MTVRPHQLLDLNFWKEYLSDLGWSYTNSKEWIAGSDGKYGEYCVFKYGKYSFKLDIWHFGNTELVFSLRGPGKLVLRDVVGSESISIELNDLKSMGMDLLQVLKAIVDPSQAPLCIHIEWAKSIIDHLLTTSKQGS